MLYTRKGDGGTTQVFDSSCPVSKASAASEALGSLDELNSFLGLVKVKSEGIKITTKSGEWSYTEILHEAQKNLFIVQAECAGSAMSVPSEKVADIEKVVDAIEKELPPINTFFISGGTEVAALLDVARTLARRAERRVVALVESGERTVGPHTKSYLNRLSSLFYALTRLTNHLSGITESAPDYR